VSQQHFEVKGPGGTKSEIPLTELQKNCPLKPSSPVPLAPASRSRAMFTSVKTLRGGSQLFPLRLSDHAVRAREDPNPPVEAS
jgi:hypothetical protein